MNGTASKRAKEREIKKMRAEHEKARRQESLGAQVHICMGRRVQKHDEPTLRMAEDAHAGVHVS